MVALHRDPAPGAGVLYNILTRLRKRHSEPHRRLRLQPQLGRQDGGRALLDPAHDRMHVFGRAHRGHGQEHVALVALDSRDAAVDLEQLGRLAEEPGPRPVAQHIGADRKSTRLNSSHLVISYAVFCLKKKKKNSDKPYKTAFMDPENCTSYTLSRTGSTSPK